MSKLITIGIGLLIGLVVDEVAADVLRDLGVPPHTAKVVGGIAGALV